MLPVHNVSIHWCCTQMMQSFLCCYSYTLSSLSIFLLLSQNKWNDHSWKTWSQFRRTREICHKILGLGGMPTFWVHLSKFSNPSLTAIKESDQRVRTALLREMVCQGKRLCEKEAELPVWGCVGLCGAVWGCVGLCGARGRGRQPDCSGKGRIRRSLQGDTAARCTKMLPNTRNNGHWNSFYVQETNPSVSLSSPQW